MTVVSLAGSGLVLVALTVLLCRRVITAGRYAQATGGLAIGWLIAAVIQAGGAAHGG